MGFSTALPYTADQAALGLAELPRNRHRAVSSLIALQLSSGMALVYPPARFSELGFFHGAVFLGWAWRSAAVS